MDSELEELFRRNQTNLTHIKQEIAVMKGEKLLLLIDEAPASSLAPQERDPDVDTPAILDDRCVRQCLGPARARGGGSNVPPRL